LAQGLEEADEVVVRAGFRSLRELGSLEKSKRKKGAEDAEILHTVLAHAAATSVRLTQDCPTGQ
jgi:hypothetical protein